MEHPLQEYNPFIGRWRIISMELWDQAFIDMEEEGYFAFDDNDAGELHFGCVYGRMDCRFSTQNDQPAAEWSWAGNDEMDEVHGRGLAVLKQDELHGKIHFDYGDESGFVAKKQLP